ncbi:hypothetical protein BDZ91DRAFT_768894 [Kalaharituber pfeilii]|nr:hypothetical protein BDZ91DRAFT_768894 [Kalaharituber pfeilii]
MNTGEWIGKLANFKKSRKNSYIKIVCDSNSDGDSWDGVAEGRRSGGRGKEEERICMELDKMFRDGVGLGKDPGVRSGKFRVMGGLDVAGYCFNVCGPTHVIIDEGSRVGCIPILAPPHDRNSTWSGRLTFRIKIPSILTMSLTNSLMADSTNNDGGNGTHPNDSHIEFGHPDTDPPVVHVPEIGTTTTATTIDSTTSRSMSSKARVLVEARVLKNAGNPGISMPTHTSIVKALLTADPPELPLFSNHLPSSEPEPGPEQEQSCKGKWGGVYTCTKDAKTTRARGAGSLKYSGEHAQALNIVKQDTHVYPAGPRAANGTEIVGWFP